MDSLPIELIQVIFSFITDVNQFNVVRTCKFFWNQHNIIFSYVHSIGYKPFVSPLFLVIREEGEYSDHVYEILETYTTLKEAVQHLITSIIEDCKRHCYDVPEEATNEETVLGFSKLKSLHFIFSYSIKSIYPHHQSCNNPEFNYAFYPTHLEKYNKWEKIGQFKETFRLIKFTQRYWHWCGTPDKLGIHESFTYSHPAIDEFNYFYNKTL